jgi:hypothetical protein
LEKPAAPAPADDGAAPSENGKAPRKSIVKGPRVKAPAALTVTLAYAGGEWTVAAQQGTKALAKPYPIRPSEALRMRACRRPGCTRWSTTSCRWSGGAEHQAEKLRTELAEIEAKLDLRAAS